MATIQIPLVCDSPIQRTRRAKRLELDNCEPLSSASRVASRPGQGAWRHEWKYLVPRPLRSPLTKDIRAFCDPDPLGGPNGTYSVRSLYFDSLDRFCLHDKLEGLPNRHKLRIRAYLDGDKPVRSVKFEIKHRDRELIRKEVVPVARERYQEWLPILRRQGLPNAAARSTTPNLESFLYLKHLFAMMPVVNVQFRREAYSVRQAKDCRVTLDDMIVGWRATDLFDRVDPPPYGGDRWESVLEIKMTMRMPFWLGRLIAKYRLQRTSASKYLQVGMQCGA